MKQYRAFIFIAVLGLCLAGVLPSLAHDEVVSVSCQSPSVMVPAGGGTATADVICIINAPDANSAYRITGSANNFMAPGTIYLSRLLSIMTARLQPVVISPDNSVTSIVGTSSGFTAQLSSSPTPKTLRFQYAITAPSGIASGSYTSFLNPAYFRYRICTNPACSQDEFTGTAPATLYANVTTVPVSVSCASTPTTAVPGGGPFNLDVLCTITGSSPDKLSPSAQNIFSPGTVTLSNGGSRLTATLQPTVISPDSSVSNITGTAGGGFTGNINALPAQIQVQYRGQTTATTPAGTYTSAPVVFAWSTL